MGPLESIYSKKYIYVVLIKIILLFLLGCVSSYGLPYAYTRTLYYSLIFILFLKSKDKVFWGAFLFILLSNPLGLLEYRWYSWIITLTSTVGITYKSMYGIVFLIKQKGLKTNEPRIIDYSFRYYKSFIIYSGFLLVIGIFYGFSIAHLYSLTDFLPSLLLFLVLPRFFQYKELLAFNKIIFLFTIVLTVSALFSIITSGLLVRILTFGISSAGVIYKEGLVRITGGIFLAFYSMVSGLYYVVNGKKEFKKWHLWSVVLISWLFILSSATRGWMIASSFLLFSTVLYYSIKIPGSAKTIFGFMLIAFFGYYLLPTEIKSNLNSAFERLETLEALSEGDLTGEGTISRFTERGPRVLTRFKESPIFGYGYSKITHTYFDPHVGNHDLLLIGGILGLLIVWFTIFAIVLNFYRFEKKGYGSGIFVYGIAIISIMIIHSTSRNMVSFLMPADSAFLVSIIIGNVNAILHHRSS